MKIRDVPNGRRVALPPAEMQRFIDWIVLTAVGLLYGRVIALLSLRKGRVPA